MGHKPLTRFVVDIGGELKRLLSVRQVKQGGIILRTYCGSFEPRNGRLLEVKTAKHSIHPTDRSATGATLVHMTTEYADKSTKEYYLLTHAVRDGCFQPIYSRTVIDPRLTDTLQPHPKDKMVHLGGYDPANTSMHYTIWLSAARAADDFPLHPAYSSAVCSFDRFSLSMVWGFTPVPSKEKGVMIHFMTTSEDRITERERRFGYTTGISPGAFPHEVAATAIYELNHVIDHKDRHPMAGSMVAQPSDKTFRPPKFFPSPP